MASIKIAIVGFGKIARDQHLRVLSQTEAFQLVAMVDPHSRHAQVQHYADLNQLFAHETDLEAVAICTPPQVRGGLAEQALDHGCHVLLEKPPAATVREAMSLLDIARKRHLSVFAAWHSRFAAGVESARQWLETRHIQAVRVQWKEDVQVWHPGQAWIWQSGGFGVFDPGINALSILSSLIPADLVLEDSVLRFQSRHAMPIAARLRLTARRSASVVVDFDFDFRGTPIWNISVDTDEGKLVLSRGGAVLQIDGKTVCEGDDLEYPKLYDHFASLIESRTIDVDLVPLQLVEDALAHHRRVEAEF
jgi:predicted dehydrogenase